MGKLTPLAKFRSLFLIALAVILSACSDTKGPPDDDGGSSDKPVCTSLTPEAYSACARSVLASTSLSPGEVDSLAHSCDDASQASPQTSPFDVFEAARATVRETCQ